MNPDFMGDLVVGLGFMCVFLFVLCLGGLIADYVFPHIPFIQRWFDSLPEYEDDEDVIREYEESRRRSRERRAERRGGEEMKAKDYYKKYRDEIVSKDEKQSIEAITAMVKELSGEVKETIKFRRVKTDSGAVAVIREMNQKYNAVVTLFEKEFGASPLLRNGFREYWKKEVPELKRFM